MSVVLIAGTQKGAMIYRSDERREHWEQALQLAGWMVTATARDAAGRIYVAVNHPVYGATVLATEDCEHWDQLASQPRYGPDDVGNDEHNRIIAAQDFEGKIKPGGRYVDQIWKLHCAGGALYAGVSEAGVFRTDDGGKSWTPLSGLNDAPDRTTWDPGAGGLCAHTVLTDAADPSRIWVGISAAGVFRSSDGGATFEKKDDGVSRDAGWCIHSLAHDPANADVIFRQDHRGMYRTRNGGDSWEPIENGLPTARLNDDRECVFGFASAYDRRSGSVYILPLDGEGLRYPKDGRLRVYRSRDEGDSWQELHDGLPDTCYAAVLRGAMDVDELDPAGVYFGDTSGAVYASRNGGDAWTRLPGTLARVLTIGAFAV